MSHSGLVRRYLLFFAGVLCSALGISLITLAGMGTSAVSSLAYVFTFVFPGVSLGTFTFAVNCAMLVGQILVLRRKFQLIQLLQIPATFVFSFCIDLWMSLLPDLVPQSYLGHWVVLLLGCGKEGCYPLHSSRFTFDEALMETGLQAYGTIAGGSWEGRGL